MNQFVKYPSAGPRGIASSARTPPWESQEAEDDAIDIRALVLSIWRRKWLVVLCALLGTALAVAAAIGVDDRYTASARVIFEPERVQIIDLDNVLVTPDSSATGLQNQVEILRSANLLDRVIEILRLERTPEFNAQLRTAAPPLHERAIARLNLPPHVLQKLADFGLIAPTAPPNLTNEEEAERRRAQALDALNDHLRLRPLPNTQVIEISYTSGDPVLAATIANTIAEQYILVQAERKRDEITAASETLSVRVQDLENRLNAAEEAVRIAELELTLDSQFGPALLAKQLEILNEALTEARLQRATIEERHDRVVAAVEDEESFGIVPDFRESEVIRYFRSKERELEEEIASLRSVGAREESPQLTQMNTRLDMTQRNIRLEAENIAHALATELETARAREASLQADLEGLEGRALEQSRAEMRISRLEREAQASRSIYETFLHRLQEAREQANLQRADASFLTRASIPAGADVGSRLRTVLIGGIIGSFSGLGLIFLLEKLNNSFRDPDEVEVATGLPLLGATPSVGSRRRPGQLVDRILQRPSSALAEAMRNLRTSILFSSVDRPPQTIMFASSLPKEGKTTTALLMAVVTRQMDRSAIIVDCDLRRQTLTRAFAGATMRRGLLSLLNSEASVEEAVHIDPKSGAHVLTCEAGRRLPGNPADILASKRFENMLEKLKARYDLVILDTPPTLVVADARIVAKFADSVVYLVHWNRTARNAVLQGVRELASVEARIAGIALTLVNEAQASKHVNAEYLCKRRYKNYISP